MTISREMTWCPQKVRNSSFSTIIWKYTWNQSPLDVCGVPKKVIPHLYQLMGCYISIKIRKSVSHTKLGSNTACHPGCTSVCYRKWLCPREWVFWPHNNLLFAPNCLLALVWSAKQCLDYRASSRNQRTYTRMIFAKMDNWWWCSSYKPFRFLDMPRWSLCLQIR